LAIVFLPQYVQQQKKKQEEELSLLKKEAVALEIMKRNYEQLVSILRFSAETFSDKFVSQNWGQNLIHNYKQNFVIS
jgi:hypothetical protein